MIFHFLLEREWGIQVNLSINQREAINLKFNKSSNQESLRTLPYQDELRDNFLTYKLIGPYSKKSGGKIEINGEVHRFIIRKKGVIFGLQSSASGHEKMRLIANKQAPGETGEQFDRRIKDNKLLYMAFKHRVERHQKVLETKARKEKEADSFVASNNVDSYIKQLEEGRTKRLTNQLIAYNKKQAPYNQYSSPLDYKNGGDSFNGMLGSVINFGQKVYGEVQETLSTDQFKFNSKPLLHEDGTTILATTYGWELKY